MAISTDIYEITEFTNSLKSKFMEDVPEETLAMGTFGYMSTLVANLIQDAAIRASEYSNEAIPTRAKFEKNIITHALSLGISSIFATPATMKVLLCFPEDQLLNLMRNNKFVFDKDIKIYIGDYEFHTDYDIIISKKDLTDGYTYTAMYNIVLENTLSDITNPYLPPVAIVKSDSSNLVVLTVTIRQVEHKTAYKKILTDNVIENKTFTFSYDGQIADFYIEAVEGNETHYLFPVYDGLTVDATTGKEYCSYTFLNSDTIRIKFNSDSYQPLINCDLTAHIKTCQGSKGNFPYIEDSQIEMASERYDYGDMYMIVKTLSDSEYGVDKKSVSEIKKIIPKEASSRGSIINTTDLENFFNSIDTDKCKVYFYKKKDNQLERLYYSYILLKDSNNNIIPTNTFDVRVKESDTLSHEEFNNMIIQPSTKFYLPPSNPDTGVWGSTYCMPATDPDLVNLTKSAISANNDKYTKEVYITTSYYRNAKSSYMLKNSLSELSDSDYQATDDYEKKYKEWAYSYIQFFSEEEFINSDEFNWIFESYISSLSKLPSEEKLKNSNTFTKAYELYLSENDLFKSEEDLNNNSDYINISYQNYLNDNDLSESDVSLDKYKETIDYQATVSSYVFTQEQYQSTEEYAELASSSVMSKDDYMKTTDYLSKKSKYIYTVDTYANDNEWFVYINPFLLLLDKNPLHTSSFLTTINTRKYLEFSFINQNSEIQFISSYIDWKKGSEDNNYEITLDMTQNISKDTGLIITDEDGNITETLIKPFVVLSNTEGANIAYIEGKFKSYDEDVYTYTFSIDGSDSFTDGNRIRINNLHDIGTGNIIYADLDANINATIYIFAKFDGVEVDKTGNTAIYKLFPDIDDYTLCNNYTVSGGLNLFYNYTSFMSNPITIEEDDTGDILYTVKKVPLVRASYVTNEDVLNDIIDEIESRRKYLEYCLDMLEDSFGIDLKFFNTYGPTSLYYVGEGKNLNSINLHMKFRISTVTNSDKMIISDMVNDIKDYMEDINEITDLHIPNLITMITTKYREQLNYFEFLDCNGYGPGYQHFYRPNEYLDHIVPEFLNIATDAEGNPEIEIIVN